MLIFLSLLQSGCKTESPPGSDQSGSDSSLRVVIVVMDGVRMEESFGSGVSDLNGEPAEDFLPRIWEDLVPLGTLVAPAYQLGVTATGPGHAQLLTGRRIRYGQYPTGADDLPGSYVPEVPGLFQALSGDEPGLVVGNTFHVNPTTHSLYPGADAVPEWILVRNESQDVSSDDREVVEAFIQKLDQLSPAVALINLHTADNLGHQSSDPQDYIDGVYAQDVVIPLIWSALQSREEYAGRTLLVVTSDHGRHRGEAGSFQEHGDACSGCREVPILLIGPGVEAGEIIDTPHALIDVAPTIAALTGAELPFAEGLPIREALTDASVSVRSGLTEPAVLTVGERTVEAWVTYSDEPLARTILTVDGEVLSSPQAVEAREPVLFAVADTVGICWRELVAEDGVPGEWVPRCMVDGEGWEDIGFPVDAVSPYFRPALSWDGQALWAIYREGSSGRVVTVAREPIGVAAAWWRPDVGWQEAAAAPMSTCFPLTPVAFAAEADRLMLAIAGSESGDGRFDRRIILGELSREAAVVALEESTSFLLDGYTRQELPAIHHRDGLTSVAFVACGEEGCGVARTDHDGSGWSEPVILDQAVFPHLGPAWDADGALYWGRVGAQGAEVCRNTAADCQPAGAERLGALTATAAGVVVTVDADAGRWQRVDLSW